MTKFIRTENRAFARKEAPWAAIVVKVSGGYMAFEFSTDYDTWRNQK